MAKKHLGEIFEHVSDVFDIPGDVAVGVTRITITGRSRIHIENHKGLLDYGTEKISVNSGETVIHIQGKNLELRAMSDMELVVTGKIISVEYAV